ncbi:MAG: amino acid adenylation domain-containing protein, partial [Thioalkalivibrio sp.]|nr:amino acid adenylation domain-containing protein [Thioalkalivibrio sp.]
MDLVLHVSPQGEGFGFVINYRKALFPRWLIMQMAGDLTRIFEQLAQASAAQLKDFVLFETAQPACTRLLDGRDDDAPACLHTLVERQVLRTPDAVAVRFDASAVSYAELNARANRLAHALIARGVQPGALVGVCLPRSLELVVSLLAILKVGAAYVPLDPDYPVERLRYIAADAALAWVLSSPATSAWLDGAGLEVVDVADAADFAGFGAENPSLELDAAGLAYLIYTSGTTGKPKGVMIEHRNAAEMLAWAHETYSREQLAVVLAATSMCFDLSVFEMFVPLSCGGSCLLVKHILDLHEVTAVRDGGVTLINTVPSAIMQLLESGSVPDSVQVVNLAGEALLGQVVERVYAQTRVQAVYNLYGPSEDTTYSTYSLCAREAIRAPDIGIPIRGCQAFVVDRQGLVAPRGVAGELYIGGTGLSRGYWRRPELTAEKFVSGESVGVALPRLYRTGDLVRWNELGVLEFIGRLDQQVKLNGFRIELGEIESALSASGVVKSSAVLKLEDERGQRLAAFVEYPTGGPGSAVQEEQAREYLRANLPGFMLPQEWVAVDAMPLSANGKIDRKAVRARYASEWSQAAAPAGACEAASSPEEQWVVELWKRLLKVEKVGIGDNFFALGGKSLLALQLINAINKQFGCRLSMVDVFRYPTIKELFPKAASTSGVRDSGTASGLVRLQQGAGAPAGKGKPSLFLVHPVGGDVLCYLPLVERLDRRWDIYGLQIGESHQLSVEDLARGYLDLLRSVQTDGPCHLAGYSLGGTIAFEMARQLDALDETVCSVSLIDSMLTNGASSNGNLDLAVLAVMLEELGPSDPKIWRDLGALYRTCGIDKVLEQVLERGHNAGLLPPGLLLETLRGRFLIYRSNWAASSRYAGGAYRGDVQFLAATVDAVPWEHRGWDRLARFQVAQGLDCSHFEILKAPHVETVAAWLL